MPHCSGRNRRWRRSYDAIVRETVRTLGGHIELDSAPGQGTRVRIVLEHARVREEALA